MKWEDPAPGAGTPFGRASHRYGGEADRLRKNPRRWALLEKGMDRRKAYTLASNIKRGNLAAFRPAGAFEVVAKEGSVWVRFTGEGAGK